MSDRLATSMARLAAGDRPIPIMLMRLLMDCDSDDHARRALKAAIDMTVGDAVAAGRLQSLATLWAQHPEALTTIKSTLAGLVDPDPRSAGAFGILDWAKAFDRVVDVSPEASVAIYSLGDPDLLAAATEEVCLCMKDWGLLGHHRDGLDLGCGIGRFLEALAPHLRTIVGIDISGRMVAEARRRCSGLDNVSVLHGTGEALDEIPDRSLDLVLAADVFPYLVDVGGGLVQRHLEDCRRILRPGGHLLILNYAYVGSDIDQTAIVENMAAGAGLHVIRAGEQPFCRWDAAAYLLQQTR